MSDRTMDEEKITLEQRFSNIEEILGQMENSEVSLNDSFELYKKGLTEIKEANRMLDMVEKEMILLSGEGETDDES